MLDRRPSPVWCVPAACVIAATAIMALGWSYIRHGDPMTNAFSVRHLKSLRELTPQTPDSVTVVTLGSSGLKCAILEPDKFTASAATHGIPQARLVRLLYPSGVDVLQEDLITNLAMKHPTVLLVQDNALCYTSGRPSLENFRDRVRHRVNTILGRQNEKHSPEHLADDFFSTPTDTYKVVDNQDIVQERNYRMSTFAPTLRADVLRAMEACRRAGSHVFIISVPVHPRWDVAFSEHREASEARIRHVVDNGLAEPLICPLPFSGDDFLDLAHMSTKASERFTNWLLAELQRRIGQ